jgi:hypothetical protein
MPVPGRAGRGPDQRQTATDHPHGVDRGEAGTAGHRAAKHTRCGTSAIAHTEHHLDATDPDGRIRAEVGDLVGRPTHLASGYRDEVTAWNGFITDVNRSALDGVQARTLATLLNVVDVDGQVPGRGPRSEGPQTPLTSTSEQSAPLDPVDGCRGHPVEEVVT